jgi:hypothetical protein
MSNGTAFDWNNPNHAANPYSGRDPRLKQIIAVNNDVFGKNTDNGDRLIQSYEGGVDAIGSSRGATTTGYYLKKFSIRNYNLSLSTSVKAKAWVLMRIGEMYLNYAEAMNEAYGPESKGGMSMSAKAAVDAVRQRTGVAMPILSPGLTQDEMRERIRNERRVELAFEEHRFFDVRRWKIAVKTENFPLMAIQIVKTSWADDFEYRVFKKENRVFKEHMYLHPIPEAEVLKGAITQNPGWQ